MEFLAMAAKLVGISLVFLLVYYGLSTYILKKIKISKWIVLGLFVLSLILPVVLIKSFGIDNQYVTYAFQGLMIILLLWFMDLAGITKKRNDKLSQKLEEKEKLKKRGVKRIEHKIDKKTAIKPKAKPNPRRAKK
ncbi:hypothetical protein [Oceanirhabdus sp. W0125-5]|uniref:hypothetical protein n=1 Tax=Oceanirhabdus sp. W0125-5 TaxID=2999116 RepID=UPI0022F322D0|nr:hypothetical protein [Oceanirhabdus sp. W0125-5]WBW98713.1 hypothetical protein OW730_08135 [Oceanirhabdus sp. W0125-5]